MEFPEIAKIVVDALAPARFFVRAGWTLACHHAPQQMLAWEMLGGHLLDHTQTRQMRMFSTWDVRLTPPTPPTPPWQGGEEREAHGQRPLSVLWNEEDAALYVVRHLLVHGWEAYEEEPNVILSRPAQKWTGELVGTIRLGLADTAENLLRQLRRLVLMALTGTSRLPVTSWESPLPAYALGQCGYLPSGEAAAPLHSTEQFLRAALTVETSVQEQAAVMDFVLRAASPDEVPQLAALLVKHFGKCGHGIRTVVALFRNLFNGLALTPYMRLGENLVNLLRRLASDDSLGPATMIDVASYMLRHLVRHLTAFDLVTFHNRGADYPDLLLLDGLLKLYIEFIASHRGEFVAGQGHATERQCKLRRRALRQAWYLRKHYEGLAVPETPTSPGDRLRVLPPEFPRAAEEEILDPDKRTRRLFADDALDHLMAGTVKDVFAQSLADLQDEAELRELGMALFLDRPLGIAKQPGEADRTPLLSYEAFSRTIARQRLDEVYRWGLLETAAHAKLLKCLRDFSVSGQPAPGDWPPHPGCPCLEDANVAAPGFLFLRTTRGSLTEFLASFDLSPLKTHFPTTYNWLLESRDVLLIRLAARCPGSDEPLLVGMDSAAVPCIELAFAHAGPSSEMYLESCGRELPTEGLRVLRIVEGQSCQVIGSGPDLHLAPLHWP